MSHLMPVDTAASTSADRVMLMSLFTQPVLSDALPVAAATERMYVHIVARNQNDRAAKARLIFSLGHHAEVYEDIDEFFDLLPEHGLILLAEDGTGLAENFMEMMTARGIWLPVMVFAQNIDCDSIIGGIKAGVIDYLVGDAAPAVVLAKMRKACAEGQASQCARRRQAVARRAVRSLSGREAEVLRLVTMGLSNKEIARELEISPRTVEIHRMKMMGKLGARTAAQAIRVEIEAAGLL